MTLVQLRAFVLAATLGTFSAAAKQLNLSQPAVSDLINRMEQELETSLFRRGNRALALTAAGERLLPFAEQMLALAEQGRKAVSSEAITGSTAFGIQSDLIDYVHPDVLPRFRTIFPDADIRVSERSGTELRGAVRSGQLGAALVLDFGQHASLRTLPLIRDTVVALTRRRERANAGLSAEDLCSLNILVPEGLAAPQGLVLSALKHRRSHAGCRGGSAVQIVPSTLAVFMARGGDDAVLLPHRVAATHRPTGVTITSLAPPLWVTLTLIRQQGSALTPACREMARMVGVSVIESATKSGFADLQLVASVRELDDFFN